MIEKPPAWLVRMRANREREAVVRYQDTRAYYELEMAMAQAAAIQSYKPPKIVLR